MAVYGDDEILYPIDDENQEVYNPVSSIRNAYYPDEQDDTEEFLKKHTLNRRETVKKDLSCYYCAVCGRSALLINAKLERLPTRQTDGSIIVDLNKHIVKHYAKPRDGLLAIRRAKGVDVIREYRCQCDTPIAYTCLNALPHIKEACRNINIKGMAEHEKVMFFYNDGMVLDSKNSLVFAEMASLKFDS